MRPWLGLPRLCCLGNLTPLATFQIRWLNFLHLREFQFHRRRTAEDRHRDLQARTIFVHFFHHAVERGERPVGHAHLLADFENDRGLGPLGAFLNLIEDAVDFALAQRHRLVVLTEKAGDLRHVLDQMVGFVGEVGLDQNVTGQEFAFRIDLMPAAHFHDFLGRNQHILDEIGEYRRDTLEALREPLERGVVDLARAGRSVQLPSAALVVATGNPCGCGELEHADASCRCTPAARRRGSLALSAPIRDRFALRLRLARPSSALDTLPAGTLSTLDARQWVAAMRRELDAWTPNERSIHLLVARSREATSAMERAGGRGGHYILAIARICALMNGGGDVTEVEIAEAMHLSGRGAAS